MKLIVYTTSKRNVLVFVRENRSEKDLPRDLTERLGKIKRIGVVALANAARFLEVSPQRMERSVRENDFFMFSGPLSAVDFGTALGSAAVGSSFAGPVGGIAGFVLSSMFVAAQGGLTHKKIEKFLSRVQQESF